LIDQIEHDAAGFSLMRQRRGLRLQGHRIADAVGDGDGVVRGAGKLAIGHADAGRGEDFLAQPLRLRALAEPRHACKRSGIGGHAGAGERASIPCIEVIARSMRSDEREYTAGLSLTACMMSGGSGQVSPSATITLGFGESAMPLLKAAATPA